MAIWQRHEGGRLARVAHWAVRNHGANIIGGAIKRYREHQSSNKRRRVDPDSGMEPTLNSQFPARTTYRRRKETRKHKSRRLRQAKVAIRAELADIRPQRFYKFNNATITCAVNTQAYSFLAPMYSFQGLAGVNDHLGDLALITTPIYSQGLASSAGFHLPASDGYQQHLHFESCRYTLEIVNNETKSVYLTMYKYVCKDSVDYAEMNTLLATQKTWSSGTPSTTALTIGTINATPFDMVEVMQKVIILGKVEILLAPSSTQEYEWNDTQNKSFDCAKLGSVSSQVGLSGWTKGYFVAAVGPASSTNNATALTAGVTFMGTYRYSLKVRLDESMLPSTAQTFSS